MKPATSDRPYAGILSFGIHRHLKKDGLETSLGLDLVAVGNQTGLLDLQRGFHNIFGIGSFDAVPQIGDAVYPTISAELAKPIDLSNSVWIRPFVEAQAGAETFVRAGVDLEFGSVRKKLFTVRDVTTGQLIPSHVRGVSEFSVVSLGLDLARVFDSYYLPSSSGLIHYKERPRVRVGIYRGGRSGTFFYGLTWLGKEFKGQPEGQVIGSVSMNLRF